jgi:hypothetical protein
VYHYATTILIPNQTTAPYIIAPVLDCHGAELNWTARAAAGDQLTVEGENAWKSGEIRNCRFTSDNPASTITFWSRIDFKVSHSSFGMPIRFINDTAHGGPGYAEENHWDDIEISVLPGRCGISFEQAPGLNTGGSFFYNWWTGIHLSLEGDANGFCMRSSSTIPPGMQGASFELTVNANTNGNNHIFLLERGTSIARGVVTINGEASPPSGPGTTYDVYVPDGSAVFYNFGSSNGPFPHRYGPNVPLSNITFIGPQIISNDLGSATHATRTLSGEPGGTAAQRICENQQIGNVTAFLLAAYGPENDCFWEVAYRSTDNAEQDVEHAGASGKPITTRIWTSSQTGVGFGPNYGVAKSNILPRPGIALETSSGLGITTPTPVGTGMGARFQASIDPKTGNLTDSFFGGIQAGQPSFLWQETIFDLSAGKNLTGLTRYAANGAIHYALPTLKLGSGPELTGVQGSTGNKLAAAAGTFTPGDAVTTDASGNLIDAGHAFTGARQAGPCTFTIVKGLITNVTGC